MKLARAFLRVLALIGLTAASVGCSGAPTTEAPPSLTVNVLYPAPTDSRQMGQSLKSIIRVLDQQGRTVADAQVSLSILDPAGDVAGQLTAAPGSGNVYRSEAWTIPHKMQAGEWSVQVEARSGNAWGRTSTAFRVRNSISEDLLNKYGFWVDAPALRGIVPDLVKEQGDARSGAIIWGGLLPAQHIFVENWLEVQWREGDFRLSNADEVRSFMLGQLGDFGFSPVRALGPFERVQFKGWDAWQVKARGQYSRYDEQWMIFYAPEAGKTYAIGTTVVLPPVGVDAHAVLRNGFEVHPEVNASGIAPVALPRLLRAPELVSPELAARFMGAARPIILKWQPLKTLDSGEVYRVQVDYNYSESNTLLEYWTRDTQLVLPPDLYDVPNCGVFNWRVTLMQETGRAEDGQPEGVAVSYGSLYWYVEWLHPAGEPAPFQPRCPNPQT